MSSNQEQQDFSSSQEGGKGYRGKSYGYGYGYGSGSGYGYGGYSGYGQAYGGYGSYGDEEIKQSKNIKDYLLVLRERFWWIVATLFIIFSASVIYTMRTTPEYESEVRLEILEKASTTANPGEIIGGEIRANPMQLRTQIYMIQSGTIVSRVNNRLTPAQKNRLKQPYEGSLNIFGTRDERSILADNRKVDPLPNSYMVAISFHHPDQRLAADIANLFAEEYIQAYIDRSTETARRAIEELKISADTEAAKSDEIGNQIKEFHTRHGVIFLFERRDIDDQELAAYTDILNKDKFLYNELQTQVAQIKRQNELKKPLTDLEFIATNPQVSQLVQSVSSANIMVAGLRTKYGEKHPKMIETIKALETATIERDLAIKNTAEKIEASVSRLKQNYENSLKRVEDKKLHMVTVNQLRIEFNKLEDALKRSKAQYEMYQVRIQQLMNLIQNTLEPAKIIDRAVPASTPSKPNIPLNLILGLVVGLVAGVALAFGISLFDDRIKTAFDIESGIGIPILGLVPSIKRMNNTDRARIVAANGDKRTIEAFRSLHSTLKLSEESRKAKVFITTSTIPGEGKSFVSSNLAATFAMHGEKTVLVDCDLRMPNVAKSLDLPNEIGVISHIKKGKSLEEVTQKDFVPNLDVIPTGGKSKNPTQLLSSQAFQDFIHELRLRYEKVVIDTPPLAPVSDALNILPYIDGVIYVIKFNTVKKKTIKNNVRKLLESDTPLFGAVLNNISINVASYYYSHYYDKSYESYYLDDNENEEQQTTEELAAQK